MPRRFIVKQVLRTERESEVVREMIGRLKVHESAGFGQRYVIVITSPRIIHVGSVVTHTAQNLPRTGLVVSREGPADFRPPVFDDVLPAGIDGPGIELVDFRPVPVRRESQ